jgi:hypothetical protein
VKTGRRRQPSSPPPDANPYLGLRRQFLELGADTVAEPLRGVAFELGMAGGSATVVCVADGTTSMYTSGGGGYLGMGGDESVRAANAAFRAVVTAHLDALEPVADVPLPAAGEVSFVAVTADGLRLLTCPEAAVQDTGSPAHPLYVAGQDVVTGIRLAVEAQGR